MFPGELVIKASMQWLLSERSGMHRRWGELRCSAAIYLTSDIPAND